MTSTPAETIQDACPICRQPFNDVDPVTPEMHGDSECGYLVHAACWRGLSTANHNVRCHCGQIINAPPCPICADPIADRTDRALHSHGCGYDMHRTCWEGLGGYAGCFCGEMIQTRPIQSEQEASQQPLDRTATCPLCGEPLDERTRVHPPSHGCEYEVHLSCWLRGTPHLSVCWCGELVGPAPPPDELRNNRSNTVVRDESDSEGDTSESEEAIELDFDVDELQLEGWSDPSSDSDHDNSDGSDGSDDSDLETALTNFFAAPQTNPDIAPTLVVHDPANQPTAPDQHLDEVETSSSSDSDDDEAAAD